MYHSKIHILILLFAFLLVTPINAKNFVLVIDAGHGGKDVGAVGINTYEKNVNLGVALKLGKFIRDNFNDVDLVYTRNTDKFITLKERSDIANKSNGDLFISIHANSISKKAKNRRSIHGASTYTLGLHKSEENLDVAIRENSVMELEPDYSTTYKGFDPNSTESYIIFEISQQQHMDQSIAFAAMVQNELHITAERKDNGVRQAGYWLLHATSMPAVLVELDYICNPTEELFMKSDEGQSKLAKAIFNAFCEYKNVYDKKNIDSSNTIISKALSNNDESKTDAITSQYNENNNSDFSYSKSLRSKSNHTIYRIQILASDKKLKKNDKRIRNIDLLWYYEDDGYYKYTTGCYKSESAAAEDLQKVAQKYKDAFIVKFENNKRIE